MKKVVQIKITAKHSIQINNLVQGLAQQLINMPIGTNTKKSNNNLLHMANPNSERNKLLENLQFNILSLC